MKRRLFIDTGALYAKYVARDEHHARAKQLWADVQRGQFVGITTPLVIAELVTLLAYRFGARAGIIAGREIQASRILKTSAVDATMLHEALDWLERFADQRLSMTDAVSFVVMTKERLDVAFTFDHHFTVAGFLPFHGVQK